MVTRALQSLLLFLELAGLGALAMAVACGSLPKQPGMLIWAGGLLLAAALAIVFVLPKKWSRSSLLHGTLLASSTIFFLPFVWLVESSVKSQEEFASTPTRWLPSLPPSVTRSPYTFFSQSCPTEPAQMTSLWTEVNRRIPRGELQVLNFDEIAPAVTSRLSQKLREAGLALPANRVNDRKLLNELIDQAWRESVRAVDIGPLAAIGADNRTIPVSASAVQWNYQCAEPVTLSDGTLIKYDFAKSHSWQARATIPIDALPTDFKGFTVSLRQDASWHRVTVQMIRGNSGAITSDALYLGSSSWVEWTFCLPSDNSHDQRGLGVWPLTPVAVQSSPVRNDQVQIILTVEQSSALGAAWAKLTASYREAWYADPHWLNYFRTSLLLVVANVVGQLIGCSMAAYAFSRLRWPGRDAVFLILLATMMLPPQVTMIPSFIIFRSLGWYNTLLPLWVPSVFGSPFFIFMLRQFMKGVPRDLEEAALIDGCGWFGIYWRIVLPLLKPALAAVAIFTFLNVWNDFMSPLIYITDQRHYPRHLVSITSPPNTAASYR